MVERVWSDGNVSGGCNEIYKGAPTKRRQFVNGIHLLPPATHVRVTLAGWLPFSPDFACMLVLVFDLREEVNSRFSSFIPHTLLIKSSIRRCTLKICAHNKNTNHATSSQALEFRHRQRLIAIASNRRGRGSGDYMYKAPNIMDHKQYSSNHVPTKLWSCKSDVMDLEVLPGIFSA